jgi:hypothetical protein
MFIYLCPNCDASAHSAASASHVGACPRCGEPLGLPEAAPVAAFSRAAASGRATVAPTAYRARTGARP